MANSLGYTHNYHPNPRLSANQLADYITANPVARRSLLRDAKFPSTAITIRYEDARKAVVASLAGSEVALEYSIQRLKMKSATEITDYCRRNCELCIDAIESFRGAISSMSVGKTIFKKPSLHNSKLKISDVNISVSIDLMTEETNREGKTKIGAAILVLSRSIKDVKEMEQRCKTIALLIYQLLKSQGNTSQLVDPSLCIGIDVFNGTLYRAMTAQVRLARTVETSCEEVSYIWPSIKQPTGYFGPPVSRSA